MANLFFAISFCFIAMLNVYLADGYGITTNDSQNRNRKLATPVLHSSLQAATGAAGGASNVVSSNVPHDSTVGNDNQNHNLNPSQPHFSKSATPNLNSSFSVGGASTSVSSSGGGGGCCGTGGGAGSSGAGAGAASGGAATSTTSSSSPGAAAAGAAAAYGGSTNVVSPDNNIPHKRAFGKEMVNHSVHFTVKHPDNVA